MEIAANDRELLNRQHTSSQQHPLGMNDVRTLGFSVLGCALAFYEFVIFIYFGKVVGGLFFPTEMSDWMQHIQTYGIFAVGYVARTIGGIMIAHFGDRLGRKPMFTLSIFFMAVATMAIGVMPTYACIGALAPCLLLFCRVVQGAAIGGIAPGAWVLVSEHVPKCHVGLACGMLSASLVVGSLFGSLAATVIQFNFSSHEISRYGWRIPFLIGGLLGILFTYLHRWLDETPIFKELQSQPWLSEVLPIKTVLKQYLPSVLVSIVLNWVFTTAIVVTFLMVPSLFQTLIHLDPVLSLKANCIATFFVMVGCLVSGGLADRFGERMSLGIFGVGLTASFWAFYSTVLHDTTYLFPLNAVVGFFVGIVGVIPVIVIKSFPAPIRFSGVSFSYNIAYAIFGGMTPMIVSGMMIENIMAPVYYVAEVSLIGFMASLIVIRSHPSVH